MREPVLPESSEEEEPEPELTAAGPSEDGEDELMSALAVKPHQKFALWLDPNAGDGTFRYRDDVPDRHT